MAHRNTGIKLVRTGKNGALIQNIPKIGPSAKALRGITVEQLKGHMEAFYEHGTLPDLLLLCTAFDYVERQRHDWSTERAWLIDALLTICNR